MKIKVGCLFSKVLVVMLGILAGNQIAFASSIIEIPKSTHLQKKTFGADVYCAAPAGLQESAVYFENRIANQLKRNFANAKVGVTFLRDAPVKIGTVENHPNTIASNSSLSINGVTFVVYGSPKPQSCRMRIPVLIHVKTLASDGTVERFRHRSIVTVTGAKVLKKRNVFDGSNLCCNDEDEMYS